MEFSDLIKEVWGFMTHMEKLLTLCLFGTVYLLREEKKERINHMKESSKTISAFSDSMEEVTNTLAEIKGMLTRRR